MDDPTGMPERTTRDEWRLVSRLGDHMRSKLAKYRQKGHWSGRSQEYLVKRMADEVAELLSAIDAGASPDEVWKEAADASNFIAMLADNYAKGECNDSLLESLVEAMAIPNGVEISGCKDGYRLTDVASGESLMGVDRNYAQSIVRSFKDQGKEGSTVYYARRNLQANIGGLVILKRQRLRKSK